MKAKLVTLLGFITILSISFILFLESNTEKKIRIIENSIKQQDDSLLSNSYLFIKENASFNNKLLTRKTDLNYTIIDDINFTLQQCRDKIVTGFLPFNVFCEFILPPVIYQESFENWRLSCIKEFSFINPNSHDIFFVCDTVNKYLGKNFSFKNRGNEYKDKSWSDYQKGISGNCFDMTKVVLYPLRSLGYATTVDYILGWGNADGSHAWNVIYDVNEKKMVPFMGLQESTTYNPFILYDCKIDSTKSGYRYPAKVFRKTFSIDEKYKKIKHHFLPKKNILFKELNFKDVTSEYFNVADVILEVDKKYDGEVLFLCVYNRNKWVSVSAAICGKNSIKFENMNKGLLYILSDGTNTISEPFILSEYSEMKKLNPLINSHIEIEIRFLRSREEEYAQAWGDLNNLPNDIFQGIANDYYREKPVNGTKYQIYIYNQGWQFISESIAKNDRVIFSRIPGNCLYIIKCQEKTVGRPFTFKNNICKWW